MFYETIADRFDVIMNRQELDKRLRLVFGDCLSEEKLSGTLVLDAGCGTGEFSRLASAQGARVVAFDLGCGLVSQAQGKASDLWGVVGDLTDAPFSEGVFDYIICSETLEHTATPQRAVGELCRLLKPGGVLVITVPNRLWGWAPHVARWLRLRPYHGYEHWLTLTQLRRWVREDNCEVISAWGFNIVPMIMPFTYRLIQWCDRYGRRLAPIMVNLGVLVRKHPSPGDQPPAARSSRILLAEAPTHPLE